MRRLFPWLLSVVMLGLSAGAATPQDVVLYASQSTVRAGAWNLVSDPSAAGGSALSNPDAGAPKLSAALARPDSYFELTFDAAPGQSYHLWVRGRAQRNSWANDSVYVQFSDALLNGAAAYRLDTTSAATVSLEDCTNCGVAGWGWQDIGIGGVGPDITFATAGPHTLRIQPREDGLTIDQVVLSSSAFRTASPGALKNDTTILPSSSGSGTEAPPRVTFVRQPYLQQTTSSGVTVVWATRESQAAAVRVAPGASGTPRTVSAIGTNVPATQSGLGYDYFQYEAPVDGLSASTTYGYTLEMNGIDVTAGTDSFTTAPLPGTGSVRFLSFGDSGTGSAAQYALASRMQGEQFDFVLHAGDLVYGNSAGTGAANYSGYQNWFFDVYQSWLRRRAVFPTIGNHDNALGSATAYRDLFVLPSHGGSAAFPDNAERFYSFDYGPVHVVSLDTETAFLDPARRQAQIDWLTNDLASTVQPWTVVFFHRPPYSSGAEHGSDLDIRNTFGPILERYHVPLVISGHDHDYERSVPIQASVDPGAEPVTYLVSGAGGAPIYSVGTNSWTAISRSVYHYLRGQATPCQLMVEAVDTAGTVFDSTSFDRCSPPPPAPAPDAQKDIVIHAGDVPAANAVGSEWSIVPDATAAGGRTLTNPNAGLPKATAAAQPASFVEVPFTAEKGVAYHVWFRMKAQGNSVSNDSVSVQFSGAVDAKGVAVAPTSTTKALSVILENATNAGVAGWGWADASYGALADPIYFTASGAQTLKIQRREDGVSIDQIVLSPVTYLTSAPGATKNDTTAVPK